MAGEGIVVRQDGHVHDHRPHHRGYFVHDLCDILREATGSPAHANRMVAPFHMGLLPQRCVSLGPEVDSGEGHVKLFSVW